MNAIPRQNRPMASAKANPKIAYVKSCCLMDGFLANPTHRPPNTLPIPAPETHINVVVKQGKNV